MKHHDVYQIRYGHAPKRRLSFVQKCGEMIRGAQHRLARYDQREDVRNLALRELNHWRKKLMRHLQKRFVPHQRGQRRQPGLCFSNERSGCLCKD